VDAVRATVTSAARSLLASAEPGSDAQLWWVRLFAQAATAADDLTFVAGLRDGSVIVEGLTIDAELRWALVVSLVRAGLLDAPDIEIEAAADHTTAGAEYAAGALAARPTAAAKAGAWASVVDRDDLPNGTQDAILGVGRNGSGGGFSQATQVELLSPYVEPYFAAVADIWASRPLEIARAIVAGLYPRLIVSPDVVARTDAYLSTAAPVPALRRLILEGRDDIERALRARQRDGVTSSEARSAS
jgi:aminopeptidase N